MIASDDLPVLTALAAMAAVTLALRLGGYWMMGYVPLTARIRRMFEALPGAVIVATVLPAAVRGGPVTMLAIAAALAVMLWRRNDFLAVLVGMAVAAGARALGGG
jgi:uncharacterized membrane protein